MITEVIVNIIMTGKATPTCIIKCECICVGSHSCLVVVATCTPTDVITAKSIYHEILWFFFTGSVVKKEAEWLCYVHSMQTANFKDEVHDCMHKLGGSLSNRRNTPF